MGIHVNRNLALELPVELDSAKIEQSDPRAELAAQFVPAGARVLDLSLSGKLENLLPHGCTYHHLSAITFDELPKRAGQSDIVVMLGVLEQIADHEGLFAHLRAAKQDVILSYGARDLVKGRAGISRGLKRLGFYDLTLLFDRHDFRVACTAPVGDGQMLMRLTPAERLKPVQTCSVAVICDGDAADFGARLSRRMIGTLLPGEADVHYIGSRALHEARDYYDLVIVGAGTSLFQPLFDNALIDVVSRGRAAVGIFGTQYRELLPRAGIDRLLDRLDTWFARNEDDILMYGRGRANAVHLGEWLIDLFPLTQANDDAPLEIGYEVDEGLERAISLIQSHKQVYSRAPEPLLCALTSAELVAYADEPGSLMPNVASGHFRSMLIDILGRSYPEKQFFLVDRDAVARYKERVHQNVAVARSRIEALLRSAAVAAV